MVLITIDNRQRWQQSNYNYQNDNYTAKIKK